MNIFLVDVGADVFNLLLLDLIVAMMNHVTEEAVNTIY